MDRDATSAVLTELAASKNQPIDFIKMEMDSGDVCITNAYREYIWGGDSYLKTGHFLSISDVEENSDLMVSSMTATLSGIEQSWISLLLSYDYIDRRVRRWLAFIDSNEDIVADPLLIFDGRLDKPVITENPVDGTCKIALSAASQWADFEKTAGRRTNHEDQQTYYSGDMGFEFASEIIKDAMWGAWPRGLQAGIDRISDLISTPPAMPDEEWWEIYHDIFS